MSKRSRQWHDGSADFDGLSGPRVLHPQHLCAFLADHREVGFAVSVQVSVRDLVEVVAAVEFLPVPDPGVSEASPAVVLEEKDLAGPPIRGHDVDVPVPIEIGTR